MHASLGPNSYGKSGIRLFKVIRDKDYHRIRDLTVAIAFEGDFLSAHVTGDNSMVFPTDTMKNTVYAKAAEELEELEVFGLTLARHFLDSSEAADVVRVSLAEHSWNRLDAGSRPHDHAFERGSPAKRTAQVSLSRAGVSTFSAGVEDLVILKSAKSAFVGYPRDRYTTLAETTDRILATSLTAHWRYRSGASFYDSLWYAVHNAMIDSFASHDSKSVQHTLFAMGEAALAACEDIDEINLTMPNQHHLPVDLTPFGMENRNEIFLPTLEPFGLIKAVVRRA